MNKQFSTSNIKYLTSDEFNQLIDAIEKHDYSSRFRLRNIAIFLVAKYCALRASEVGMIKISDIDLKNKTITCKRLKGSFSNKLLIVDDKVFKYLSEYYVERTKSKFDNPFFFLSKSGKPINRRTLHNLIKFYASFTDINPDKAHFHVLKHTRAMELIEVYRIELRSVQWWLGHKSINNTMIYLNFSVKAQRELYDKLKSLM